MTERRFLVSPEVLAAAAETIEISGPEHHHLSRVLRLKPGDEVGLFDGAGRGRTGTIEFIGQQQTRVALTGVDDRVVEPRFRLTLAQAIPRQDRMETVIQKTTELGVFRIIPLITRRGFHPQGQSREASRLERWRRVSCEATRQSGRMVVPVIEKPVSLQALLEKDTPKTGCFILDTGEKSGSALPTDLAGMGESLVMVGPEGGWDEAELADVCRAGYRVINVGPRILRTETAGIVATALMLYAAGEMAPRAL